MARHTWCPVLWILALSLPVLKCQYLPLLDEPRLECLFRIDTSSPCMHNDSVNVPDRLKLLYNATTARNKVVNFDKLETLSDEEMLDFPLQILYLMPSQQFMNVRGPSMASLVKKYPQEIGLARKTVDVLRSTKQRIEFIEHLEGADLPDASQAIIAEALTVWYPNANNWTFDLFTAVMKVGSPLLAYIPPEFLFSIPKATVKNFFYHLMELDLSGWTKKSWAIKRRWANLMFSESYPKPLQEWTEHHFERFAHILEGALYDELKNVPAMNLVTVDGLDSIKLNKLQARSLFVSPFAKGELTTESLKKLLNISLLLTPRDLQRFQMNATDFMLLQTLPLEKGAPSFSTSKQVVELLIAQLVMENKLASANSVTWQDNLANLKKFVYALPLHALKPYSSTAQSLQVITSIDSDRLTAKQARLLIGNSKLQYVLITRGLVKGVRSKTLSQLSTNDIPQLLLNQLLSNFPSGSHIKSLALLQKVRAQLGSNSILENILLNKNANQFFELLSSQEVWKNLKEFRNLFNNLGRNLQTSVKRLPQNVLSVLLSDRRNKLTQKNLLWNADNLLLTNGLNFTLLGITCNDVIAMDAVDLMLIIGKYNRERLFVQKKFPKDVQYCLQGAVLDYLLIKANLQQKSATEGLLNFLEPFEIDTIGGFICASLPTNAILGSIQSLNIFKAIGKLSFPELLVATSGGRPSDYTEAFIHDLVSDNKIEMVELVNLGSLVLFSNTSIIEQINPVAFKPFWELVEPNSKALCSNLRDNTAWNDLIIKAFGDPSTWSAGVLVTLGDLLVAVSPEALDTVPEASWIMAADTLVEETVYHVPVEWPGEVDPIPVVQACRKVLPESEHVRYRSSVHSLLRRYLMATQKLVGQIKTASELLAPFNDPAREREKLRRIPFDLGQPVLKVNVLRPYDDTVESSSTGVSTQSTNKTLFSSEVAALSKTEPTAASSSTTKNMAEVASTTNRSSILNSTIDAVTTVRTSTVHAHDRSKSTEISRTSNSVTEKGKAKRWADAIVDDSPKRQFGDALRASINRNESEVEEVTDLMNTRGKPPTVTLTRPSNNMSCDAIRATGLSAGLSLNELDILSIPRRELEDCIDMLGALDLPREVQRMVWQRIKEDDINVEWEDVGHLIRAATLEDVTNITLNLSSPAGLDILAVLGTNEIEDSVLKYLSGRILLENGEPISWPTEIVVAMGQLICTLSKPFLDRLLGRDDVFIEASPLLGRIQGCPAQCLADLARIAVKGTSYGPPSLWTAEDVASLGVIVAGLKDEDWMLLKDNGKQPLVGLQPSAVKCIPPNVFKTLDHKQMSSLSPMASAMTTRDQLEKLSAEQQLSLRISQNQVPRANLATEGVEFQYPSEEEEKDAAPRAAVSTSVLVLVVFSRFVLF